MTINGLGTFELTGPVNECEMLLRLLRLKIFSYKPHIMVTHSIVRMAVNWTEQALRTFLEVYYADDMGWIWENGANKEKAIAGTIQQMRENPAEYSRVVD